ncbi:DNA polymerase III subunit alpha [Rhodopirellula sp. MGV]|uniref:DNA polymerase III subunit alpha n=1 Tax=Rhodopirellula sp. MGV TaxID=2023130 RepID=UPI000B961C26|nr:DNA polymerase III subunit alpha [Rhodopirellula sp. MGV]OYP32278.1 DNA polymerase III subunit alpha [Rhodopirellula sp. MGV]PNY35938.1 DNA polymerase III subunit alpha [Rhodopirellula baltica]
MSDLVTEPANTRPFVHLHCHSHYSLLDGASDIKRLVNRAVDHGMNALALTDHGNLHGALEFYRTCKDAGINPIIGYEAYIAPGSRFEKGGASSSKDASYHLTLLAKNVTGFKNLIKLASVASLEGFYFKPRIDKEILETFNEGLICLSGCVSSEFSRAVMKGTDTEEAEKEAMGIASWFHKIFDDRYFIEVMNNGLDIQRMQLEGAVDIAKKMGLPLVATSDCHYVNQEDAEAQDIMLCINTGRFRTDTSRMKMENDQFFLRSPEQMYEHFPQMEDAVARSQEIANTVDIDLQLGKYYFPNFECPENKPPIDYLRELCIEGLMERYEGDDTRIIDGELSEEVIARLNRELGVIEKLNYPTYFLIVWDFVVHARRSGISATARGSGVGALVCYALYLSHVCPLRYDLLFERFLDESRTEPPDIDIDFEKERRVEVIEYVKERYGADNVCQIGTFGTLAARAAIKDTGRALGIPLARVNQITEMVPDELKITIKKSLEKSADLKQTYDGDPEIRELLDLAMKIEGLARNVGTHAAAVVIADKALSEYVPLTRVPGKQDVITQWSMGDVEASGLLKMDFLGLRNLTMLSRSVILVKQTTGKTIDPLKFPLDDKETYALLQRGETKGVFQLESGGIRDLLTRMKPDSFHDIIATAALYRPGPLEGGMVDDYVNIKHGRQEAEYKHPVLEEILSETNSVMVYQEQVMRILNRLGGVPLAKAYTCIKAISKKKEALINQNQEVFLKGAVEAGLSQKDAEDIWNLIVKFAGYGFNKSHSTAYALVAYQTAYLKTHYPVEFMASLLCSDIDGRNFKRKDALIEHMEDCDRMGIEVVPACVNHSEKDFSVADGRIHFALSAIKSCGGSTAVTIEQERKKNGPYKDIFDFCERVDLQACNKSAIETLIKAGAMDCFGAKRSQLAAVIEKAIQAGIAVQADKKSGQASLFGAFEEDAAADVKPTLPDMDEWPDREKLSNEKEVLGYYLDSHPLAEFEQRLATFRTHQTDGLSDIPDRGEVILGGMISSIKIAHTKNPKAGQPSKYANFDLEDMQGAIRCILWPRNFADHGEKVQPDAVVLAKGKIDRRGGGDEANLVIDELIPIDDLDNRYTHGMRILLEEAKHEPQTLKLLREILRGYPGNQEVLFNMRLNEGETVHLKSSMKVHVTPEMRTRLDDLLGSGCYRLMMSKPR